VSNYRILDGNSHDTQQLIPSLEQHLKNFGVPPNMVTTDRGVYSQANENYARELGIKKVILPKGGYRNQERINYERKRDFQQEGNGEHLTLNRSFLPVPCSPFPVPFYQARRWHNGVEGRISFLKRCFG
jgi:IS5 family transposase